MSQATLYARVSTEEQKLKGLSIRAQEEVCRSFCAREGWPVLASFQDEGLSAGLPLDRRPGLMLAVGSLSPGALLVVSKRDRIFRSDAFESAVIERAVASRGARIVSAAGEGTADDEPSSVLMRRLLDGFAEYERLIIKARTKAVLDSKRGRSERVGTVPYGQRLAADGKHVEPDPEEQQAIWWMKFYRDQSMSLRQIGFHLKLRGCQTKGGGPWSAGVIHRILKRQQ